MEPDRLQAKESIVVRDQNDSDLTNTFQNAHKLQLELTKEHNQHASKILDHNRGVLGKFFGDGKNATTFIVLVCILFGMLAYGYCLSVIASAKTPELISSWSSRADNLLTFIASALAYIFGRATKSE